MHNRTRRTEAYLLKNDCVGTSFPKGGIAWWLHARHTDDEGGKPGDARSREIEVSKVAIDCEHPAHLGEHRGIAFHVALNSDGEAVFMMKLGGTYDHRRGEIGEDAYVLALRREPINNIGGEPPERIDCEIETVRHLERNLVFVNQIDTAHP